MIRLAVFDCDGTLVDSARTICAAMRMAFEGEGMVWPGKAATRRIVGLSLPQVFARLAPQADAGLRGRLAERFKAAFHTLRANGLAHEPLYPGIADVLAELEARGWLLGVATGKSDRGLNLCLAAHGLHPRFVTLQTADRHPSKPHPAMLHQAAREAGADHVAMIGDTVFDIEMAVAAGSDPVGVAWGYHPADELSAAGARAVACHANDLIALLEAA